MRIKFFLSLLLLLIGLLFGCATTPTLISDAKQTPQDRILAFQTQDGDNTSTLIVIRDTGFLGGGCYASLYINKVLAARLDVAEVVRFYLEPGEVLLRVGLDGKGLCSVNKNYWTQRETSLKHGEQKTFRVSISPAGTLDIQRADDISLPVTSK